MFLNGLKGNLIVLIFRALGLIINHLKSEKLDLNSFYEDLSILKEGTTVYNEIPFQFRRYKDLSKSHFLENPERYNCNIIQIGF